MSKKLTGVMHILSVLVRELELSKSISQQAPGDTGSCPSWITLTSPAAATACSLLSLTRFSVSAHLLRTLSDSSRSSPSGSPPH